MRAIGEKHGILDVVFLRKLENKFINGDIYILRLKLYIE